MRENIGALGFLIGIIGGFSWLAYSFIKHKQKRYPFILICLGLILFGWGFSGTSSTVTNKSTTVKKHKSSYKTNNQSISQRHSSSKSSSSDFYNTKITYNQITHEPAKYLNKGVVFDGEVLQVVSRTSKSRSYILFYINGDKNQLALAKIENNDLSKHNVMEHDTLHIRGTFDGMIQYTTSLNTSKNVPAIYVLDYTSTTN